MNEIISKSTADNSVIYWGILGEGMLFIRLEFTTIYSLTTPEIQADTFPEMHALVHSHAFVYILQVP